MQHILDNRLAPGDALVMTAAVRELVKHTSPRLSLVPWTAQPSIWRNNPNVVTLNRALGVTEHKVGYTACFRRWNQHAGHFSWAYLQDIASRLRVDAVCTDIRPDVHLSPQELTRDGLDLPDNYWLVMPGGKQDFTIKLWPRAFFQKVVTLTQGHIQWVACGATGGSHIVRQLDGVINRQGATDFRTLLRIVYHARGVLCPVTATMHAAAAFNRNCVVLAGGREPWWFAGYNNATWRSTCDTEPPADFVPHAIFHTLGQLPCCLHGGCGRSTTEKSGRLACVAPVQADGEVSPACMRLVRPEQIAAAVLALDAGQRVPEQDLVLPQLQPRVPVGPPPPSFQPTAVRAVRTVARATRRAGLPIRGRRV